ncbi:MAG: RNA polymerase sigma-70 factor [Bacteroidales bacterium]
MEVKSSAIYDLIEGKEKAFEYIYNKYAAKVYNFCRKLYLSHDDAEEMVQNVFISIWEHREQINPEKSFDSYLFTITKNRITDLYKKKLVNHAYINYTLNQQKDFEFVTENEILFTELNSRLEKAIEKLPDRCKEVFILSRKEEMSYKEIADKLEITESTVNSQITKALKILQSSIFITLIFNNL